jgi:hypothetical protein
MYYLIDNDSDLSFSKQMETADAFIWLETAINIANKRCEDTGHSWDVVKEKTVYNASPGVEQ